MGLNLHQAVRGNIKAVNPEQPIAVQVSAGVTYAGDGTPVPGYSIVGGAQYVGSIGAGVLTVTQVVDGVLAAGQLVMGTGVGLAVMILSQLTGSVGGTAGGTGTYQLSNGTVTTMSGTLSSTSMFGQVQDLTGRDLRQLEALTVQGSMRSIYVNGSISGIVRMSQKGGDLITLQDGTVWLTTRVLEKWDVGWCKVAVTLQDGQ